MADSKYADLPGIAYDEPDVYETNDLPESEQTSDFYEEEADIVEKMNISPTEAYNRYKGKILNAACVDFSDRIPKSMRTGYAYELVGRGEKETILQKYQRLQCEMNELLEEVNLVKSGKKEDPSCLINVQQIEQSLKKLKDLKLEETLGEDALSRDGSQIKNLMAQLEQFKARAKDKPESDKNVDGITFQLNYRPEETYLPQLNRLSDLERRLHRMENVLGATDENLAKLSQLTSKKTLLETAQHLSATASLLDSSQLDHIEGRLTALMQKLDTIAEKKKNINPDTEGDKKINELYDFMRETEKISRLLPITVERLKSVEGLHKRAAECVNSLMEVEKTQSELEAGIENNKSLIKGVQESFANNLNEINTAITSLDARIKQVKNK